MPTVTLLSDFGTRDGFAAAMKGVIATIAPEARLVDAAHDVPRGDVTAAAWALYEYWDLFPPDTVHLAVVDPGVGGGRRAVAFDLGACRVVAPDNGLISRALDAAETWRCVEIVERRYMRPTISTTFHGRDIFAPAAAHLAAGVELDALGPELIDPIRLDLPEPERQDDRVVGRITHIDRFGNLITDIPNEWVRDDWIVEGGGHHLGRVQSSYSAVEPGDVVVVRGSMGTLEVAVRDGSAAQQLGLDRAARMVARSY